MYFLSQTLVMANLAHCVKYVEYYYYTTIVSTFVRFLVAYLSLAAKGSLCHFCSADLPMKMLITLLLEKACIGQ